MPHGESKKISFKGFSKEQLSSMIGKGSTLTVEDMNDGNRHLSVQLGSGQIFSATVPNIRVPLMDKFAFSAEAVRATCEDPAAIFPFENSSISFETNGSSKKLIVTGRINITRQVLAEKTEDGPYFVIYRNMNDQEVHYHDYMGVTKVDLNFICTH